MPKALTMRTDSRVPVRLTWRYFADGVTGKGTVWDLSRGGWRGSGSHHLPVGLQVTVYLHLPTENEWLAVDEAVVRWVDGSTLGLEIASIDESRLARLEDFLERLTSPEDPVASEAA
ncbi:MAG TPA: PilZ domain-containing protein [Nitrospiraceae bacterium]|nr:PilZ domain-containing protein [Nitrospiraceae bacterium]